MANHSNSCVSHQTSTLNPRAPPFVSRSTTCLTSLPIACINARSLRNKCAELVDFCATHSPSILCLSETWLSPNIPFAVPGYSIFRRDRPAEDNRVVATDARAYGGVAILAKSGMFTSLHHRADLHIPGFEATWVETRVSQGSSSNCLIVGAAYRPPNNSSAQVDSFMSSLQQCLSRIRTLSTSIPAMGDFNAKSAAWYGSAVQMVGLYVLPPIVRFKSIDTRLFEKFTN